MTLFKAQTVQQFKIHQWLVGQGFQPEGVAACSFPARNKVKIADKNNDAMILTLEEDGRITEEYQLIKG